MSETAFTNRLIHETSPYLLQHAHNPVNWYPWSDEALQKAKQENKPILVSIGYSACHWCHVMEKESFEDEATAAIMNAHFINIKIDREERPDLDHIYMDAVQVMTGSGGWPLNVFLTTDARPFYGGTYFPPVQAYNRMSWKDTLLAVHKTYTEKKNEIEAQADNLIAHIENANSFGMQRSWEKQETTVFTHENLELITKNLLLIANTDWGGFGKAPKFPQTFNPVNINTARLRGLEGQLKMQLADWNINTTLTLQDPRQASGVNSGKLLNRRATEMMRVEVAHDFGEYRLSSSLYAEGRRFDDLANTAGKKLSGYGLLDLRAEYHLASDWLVQGRIDNLLDKQYETAQFYNQPRRGVYFTLNYQTKH